MSDVEEYEAHRRQMAKWNPTKTQRDTSRFDVDERIPRRTGDSLRNPMHEIDHSFHQFEQHNRSCMCQKMPHYQTPGMPKMPRMKRHRLP